MQGGTFRIGALSAAFEAEDDPIGDAGDGVRIIVDAAVAQEWGIARREVSKLADRKIVRRLRMNCQGKMQTGFNRLAEEDLLKDGAQEYPCTQHRPQRIKQ